MSKNLATKQDIQLSEIALRSDMKEMESGIRSDMKEMESSIRSDMKEGFSEVRSEMKDLEHKVDKLGDKLTIRLTSIMVVLMSAMVTVLKFTQIKILAPYY